MYVDRTRQVAAAVVSIPAGNTPEDPAVDILTITGYFFLRVIFKLYNFISCEICAVNCFPFSNVSPHFFVHAKAQTLIKNQQVGLMGVQIRICVFFNGVNATVLWHTIYQCLLCFLSCSLGPG